MSFLQRSYAQRGIQTFGMGHIAIEVKDIDRSVKFYRELFNMDLYRKDEKIALLHTPGYHDRLALLISEGEVGHLGLNHFGFFVDEENYKKALDYIRDNSIKVLGGPGVWPTGSKYIYIEDPDGYKVEILTEV